MTTKSKKKKDSRLRRQSDFDRVFRQGGRSGDGQIVALARRNEVGFRRLGIVVGRKAGGAVVRNRIRRLLREAFRATEEKWPEDYDYILLPGRTWSGLHVSELTARLTKVMPRAIDRAETRRA